MPTIIKTQREYEEALTRLHALLDADPQLGSADGDEVELMTLLLSNYEDRTVEPLEPVSAIDAIRFRMEQLNLRQQDLVPYLGAASRVSEILSGKRSLTVPMIRALHEGLDIPLKALVRPDEPEQELTEAVDFKCFPIREMQRRGWISSEDDLPKLLAPVMGCFKGASGVPLFRRATHLRARKNSDSCALLAWSARIVQQARTLRSEIRVDTPQLDWSVLRDVARLSVLDTGPRVAIDYLLKYGIVIVVEPHLPRTYLDGAMIPTDDGPVIGLTLRHDRLDSFWFTLFHELAHVVLHLGQNVGFFDDIDSPAGDPTERAADAAAGNVLVPDEAWKKSPASRLRSPQAADHLARELRIHPAIVAGRIRREFNDYRVLSHMVGQGEVRTLFEGK